MRKRIGIVCIVLVLLLTAACEKNDRPEQFVDYQAILEQEIDQPQALQVEEKHSAVQETCPWEEGGKAPAEYTWEEYEALSEYLQGEFFASFVDVTEFDAWVVKAQSGAVMSWEDGGKQPDQYTLEEYNALTELQQERFFESFTDPAHFDSWFSRVQKLQQTEVWGIEGKTPDEYTWEEYDALSEDAKAEFFKTFKDVAEFDNWLMNAQANAVIPWEDGGKKPEKYTWDEYEALPELLKEKFFESFDNVEDFEQWFEENQQD